MKRLSTWQRAWAGASVLLVILLVMAGVLAMAAPASSAPAVPVRPASDSLQPDVSSLLGVSGQLRAVMFPADSAAPTPLTTLVPALAAQGPGVHLTGLTAPDGIPIRALSFFPLTARHNGEWHSYHVGFWPGERASRRHPRYELPAGFLEVTAENAQTPLSTHFVVSDFLTHDQQSVWPKVLVIRLPLLDKLELISAELAARGRIPAVRVMSGFRTPQYNALGVGPRGGRAGDSRHMYGDAADIYVDADGDGRMDDLDGDGRVTTRDAGWLADIAERVEGAHPGLTGGIGVYRANAVHGPFVHVDVRGTMARW
ncbi:MAG: hypothetical protein ABI587_09805 [Gemmatimonadales bacterium]